MGPETGGCVRSDMSQFGGELDPIAVRILDEKKEVVARPMPAWPPFARDAEAGQAIGPVADADPPVGLVAVMIEPALRRPEQCEAVMFGAGAQDGGGSRDGLGYPALPRARSES